MAIKFPETSRILTPYVTVQDAERSIQFYKNAFGFELVENEFIKNNEGKIVHAAMSYNGKSVVMFSPEDAMMPPMKSPATTGVDMPVAFYVYCADVDGFTENARLNGAKVLCEPDDMFWGDRMARFSDPDGYFWSFATHKGKFDVSKLPEGFTLG